MAKVDKARCRSDSRSHRVAPYLLPSCSRKTAKDCYSKKKHSKASEKKYWEGATCSVCLEYPHNAVLLLCSSYKNGCRPFMCATGSSFSNCLKQYKKAYTKESSIKRTQQWSRSVDDSSFNVDARQGDEKIEVPELLCPLCRGQVKGWTVVEPARKHFNAKKRTCLQDKCSFVGTYKQLKKHVRVKHPLARPRAVDPLLEKKWKKLECEMERNDIIATIMSSTPGAVVLGDYVIEPGNRDFYDDYDLGDFSDDDLFPPFNAFGREQSSGRRYRNGFGPIASRPSRLRSRPMTGFRRLR